jgi:hypothetical protein
MACQQPEKEFDIRAHAARHYPGCSAPVICKDLAYVNCNSEADGPSYYLERGTGKQISTCGGACWLGQDPAQAEMCRTLCPPPAWNCPR